MVQCPSCALKQEPRLTCRECGAPLAAAHLDYFGALGLPRKLTIDVRKLEGTYHDLGRKVHPDRFASSPALIRSASLVSTALLTQSYRTLKDPESRGRYWLELNGEKLAENNKKVPPDMLELVFEVQEQLEEFRSAAAGADGDVRRAVETRRQEGARAFEAVLSQLDDNFGRWDASDGSDRAELIADLKGILSRLAYLRRLLRDVDRELERQKVVSPAHTAERTEEI